MARSVPPLPPWPFETEFEAAFGTFRSVFK
jgi:hypothetical protein